MSGRTRFGLEELSTMQGTVSGQRTTYTEVWETVINQLRGLVQNHQVDQALGSIIEQRDAEFRRRVEPFDDSVNAAQRANVNLGDRARDGAEQMRRTAAGRG